MARSLQKIVFCFLLLLVSCASGSVMSRNDYDNVQIGTPVSEVIKQHGDPLKIQKNKDGSQDYQYVERIMIGEQTVVENKYSLVVKNGTVVSKRMNWEEPPAYQEIYEEQPNAIETLN